MIYVKVLVIVLCSCFIQEALSGSTDGGQTSKKQIVSKPKATVSKPKATVNKPDVTSKPKATKEVESKAATVPGHKAAKTTKPRTAKVSDLKRNPSALTNGAAVAVPQSFNWPHLDKARESFWAAAEDLNRINYYGNLDVRAARNAMAGVLTNPEFWSAAQVLAGKINKATHDKKKADFRIRMCNKFTKMFTNPAYADRFQEKFDDVYDTVVNMDTKPLANGLEQFSKMVDNGEVTSALNATFKTINSVDLDPKWVAKAFQVFNKSLNLLTRVEMTNFMADFLTNIGTMMKKNE